MYCMLFVQGVVLLCIVVVGDFVGGGLVLVLLVVLCDVVDLLLVGVVLYLLWMDLVVIGQSLIDNDEFDVMFCGVWMVYGVVLYLGDLGVLMDYLFVLLLYVDFMGLFMLYCYVSISEVLCDDIF